MGTAVASGSIARPGAAVASLVPTFEVPPWLRPGPGPKGPCLGYLDLFFPENYGLQCKDQIEEARRVCDFCPLRPLCKEWAIPQADLDGIWAGLTPPERRRIRVARKNEAAS